jgi:hypothetical protein
MKDSDSPTAAHAIAIVRERLKAAQDRRTRGSAETPPVGSHVAGFTPAVRQTPKPIELEVADTQWGGTVFDSVPRRDEHSAAHRGSICPSTCASFSLQR